MCLDLFSEETPVCCILGGRFDLGSITFIYLFIYLFIYFTKIRFIEAFNRRWNRIPVRHTDSSERRLSLVNVLEDLAEKHCFADNRG